MNLLLLTHRVPFPPDRGDRIRSYHLLRYLSRRAKVSLACVTQEDVAPGARQELQTLCRRVQIAPTTAAARAARDVWSLVRGRSATEGHFWSPALARAIEEWSEAEPFDAVVCFCSGMHRFTALEALRGVATTVDLVDVDSQKWADCAGASRWPASWLHGLEARRVRRLERRICDGADKVIVISDEERSLLQSITGRGDVGVAVNGVDTDYFKPAQHETPAPHACCFVGVLNYQPNVDGLRWFVGNVWPRVLDRFNDAQLRIVGRSPAPAVREFAAVPGVEVYADVPDVRPYLSRSSVAIAPLRIARGVQNKVLEAMAMGLPVVASPEALTGIAVTPGTEAAQAGDVEQWSAFLGDLFLDESARHLMGLAARRFVEQRHCWEQTLEPFSVALGLGPTTRPHAEPVLA